MSGLMWPEVLRLLAETSSFAVPEDVVVVADPRARGLAGPEGVLTYQNLLQQTGNRGAVATGASTSPAGGTELPPGVPQVAR